MPRNIRPFCLPLVLPFLPYSLPAAPAASGAGAGVERPEPLALHPRNPHYFLFRGRPAVLITSGEHYGAVLNLDFDQAAYLEELAAYGFNHTRLFSGAYRERPGSFGITGNTLAPAPGRYLCPWARSETPGYFDGGNRFDLKKWDEEYFRRLRGFLGRAGERGIVVEVNLFCTMYGEDLWRASPLNAANNINGIGRVTAHQVYSAMEPELTAVQEALARKIAGELGGFDNLYYEVCNEPYERPGVTAEWEGRIIAAIVEAEAAAGRSGRGGQGSGHLISVNLPHPAGKVPEVNPAVSLLNFHAATPA